MLLNTMSAFSELQSIIPGLEKGLKEGDMDGCLRQL